MPRLLLIEDRTPMVDFYKSLVIDPSWTVDVATDWHGAQGHIAFHRPDVVLLDGDLGLGADASETVTFPAESALMKLEQVIPGTPVVVLCPLGQWPALPLWRRRDVAIVLESPPKARQVRQALDRAMAAPPDAAGGPLGEP